MAKKKLVWTKHELLEEFGVGDYAEAAIIEAAAKEMTREIDDEIARSLHYIYRPETEDHVAALRLMLKVWGKEFWLLVPPTRGWLLSGDIDSIAIGVQVQTPEPLPGIVEILASLDDSATIEESDAPEPESKR